MVTLSPALTGWSPFVLMDPNALWTAFSVCQGVRRGDADVRQTAETVRRLEPFLGEAGFKGPTLDEFLPALAQEDAPLGCAQMLGVAFWLRRHSPRRRSFLLAVEAMLRRDMEAGEGILRVDFFGPGIGWHRHYRDVFAALERRRRGTDTLFQAAGAYLVTGGLFNLSWCAGPLWDSLQFQASSADLLAGIGLSLASLGMIASSRFISRARREAAGECFKP